MPSHIPSRNDVRVFHSECKSLAATGYDTTLVVADGLGEQLLDGVSIKDVGKPSTKFLEFFINLKVLRQEGKQKQMFIIFGSELIIASLF